MKTLVDKRCMIRTHTPELAVQVLELAKKAGFSMYGVGRIYPQYVFGKWSSWHKYETILDAHAWDDSLFKQHPDWPRFDALTQMDEIIAHFEGRPPYDETPLPHDMNQELADQTRKKFNLSPEQWDMLNPISRDALAGVEVKVESTTAKWIPVSERLPRISNTVLLTRDQDDAIDNVSSCRLGYINGGDWQIRGEGGLFVPTHWCPLPDDTRV